MSDAIEISPRAIRSGLLLCLVLLLTSTMPARAAQMVLSIENLGGTCFWGISGPCYYQEINFDVAWVIRGLDGIRIGETQPSDIAVIDFGWVYGGVASGTVELFTTAPVTVLTQDANSMTLDFSGWSERYVGFDGREYSAGIAPNRPDSAWNTGIAHVTCGLDCDHGDTYTLDYEAYLHDPDNLDWLGPFVAYRLEGHISLVPLPTALWLFGSGLLAMIGASRRRKAA